MKSKKALMVASMASMLDNFNKNNIEILHDLGYEITLAANFKKEDSNSREKVEAFRREMQEKGYNVVQIDFSRKFLNIKGQISSYRQLKKLVKGKYDLVHCHSPICAAMTRIVFRHSRKKGVKVLYTAHGFHFFKGAPIQNWLLYYPIEKIMSFFTDVLITITKEDYSIAKRKFGSKEVRYIPGVGVDINKIRNKKISKENKRKELGIKNEAIVLLSVGELNRNKNHEIVIKAIAEIDDKSVEYIIAGQGPLKDELEGLSKELKVENRVHILGFRNDIIDLCKISDMFVLPSKREGLSVALMEAVASEIPCIVSDLRGNKDLIQNSQWRFKSNDISRITSLIERYIALESDVKRQIVLENNRVIKKYSQENVNNKMKQLYEQINMK